MKEISYTVQLIQKIVLKHSKCSKGNWFAFLLGYDATHRTLRNLRHLSWLLR